MIDLGVGRKNNHLVRGIREKLLNDAVTVNSIQAAQGHVDNKRKITPRSPANAVNNVMA